MGCGGNAQNALRRLIADSEPRMVEAVGDIRPLPYIPPLEETILHIFHKYFENSLAVRPLEASNTLVTEWAT